MSNSVLGTEGTEMQESDLPSWDFGLVGEVERQTLGALGDSC